MRKELSSHGTARASRRFAKKVLEERKDKKKVCTQCRKEFLTVGLVVGTRSLSYVSSFAARSSVAIYIRIRPNSSHFILETLIFVVLVANFIVLPDQVNCDVLTAGIYFTNTIQNVLEIATIVVAAVIMDLHTIVIVIVATDVANPVSKIFDQRQLR